MASGNTALVLRDLLEAQEQVPAQASNSIMGALQQWILCGAIDASQTYARMEKARTEVLDKQKALNARKFRVALWVEALECLPEPSSLKGDLGTELAALWSNHHVAVAARKIRLCIGHDMEPSMTAAEKKREKKKLSIKKRKAVAATEAHSLVETAIAGGIATIIGDSEMIVVEEGDSIIACKEKVDDREISTTEPESAMGSESEQSVVQFQLTSQSFEEESCGKTVKDEDLTSKSTAVPSTPCWSAYGTLDDDDDSEANEEVQQAEVNDSDRTMEKGSENSSMCDTESDNADSYTSKKENEMQVESATTEETRESSYGSYRAQAWREQLLRALAGRSPIDAVQSLCASVEAVVSSTEEMFVLDQMELVSDVLAAAEMHRVALWSAYQKYGPAHDVSEDKLFQAKKFRASMPYTIARAWCPETSPDQLAALCQSVPMKLMVSMMDTVSGRFRVGRC